MKTIDFDLKVNRIWEELLEFEKENRLKILYDWVKQNHISYKEFESLIYKMII